MLKIISGAVINTAHAHPGVNVNERFARGVAKRACGTLSAQWAEVLAAQAAPSGVERLTIGVLNSERKDLISRRRERLTPFASKKESHPAKALSKRKASRVARARLPRTVKQMIRELSARVKPARLSGRDEYAEGLIEALKIIGGHLKREQAKLRGRKEA